MASVSVSELFIGGVEMPTPALEGVTISSEKIWSSNTGRTSSGKMAGTIVAIKTTVKIKWPPLTMAQAKVIDTAVSDKSTPFTTLKYTDMGGTTVTKKVYFGTPSYTQYSWSKGMQWVENVEVEAIEQ